MYDPAYSILWGLRRTSKVVMGREDRHGLCNAVILAEPNASFVQKWYGEYRHFDRKKWNYHSVLLPRELAKAIVGSVGG